MAGEFVAVDVLSLMVNSSKETMKAFLVLTIALLVRDTIATPVLAVAETGQSAQFRSEDNLGNYNFGYNEDHTSGGTFRREVGDAHGNVAGSYGLRDADGRVRIVNYIANDDGFKADIKTNEPGVEPKDTADASFNKAESVLVQSVAAPPVVAVPAAGPVAYAFPEPSAVPVAKSHTTVTTTETKPAAYAIHSPVAVAQTYAFPAPAAVPVAKSHTTVTTSETKPAAYAIGAPTYAFPAAAAVPVAKSHTTFTETVAAPAIRTYAFPEPAAVPVAKSIAAPAAVIAEPVVRTYAFPAPAAVPVAKSHTTVTETVAAPAVRTYAFPEPAAVPVAKSATIQYAAAPAPLTYAAAPIATAPLAYAAAPTSKFSYTTEVRNAPAVYAAAPSAYAVQGLRYHINPHISAINYATPFYNTVYSPAVASFAGAVPYFNNIAYKGTPFIKK